MTLSRRTFVQGSLYAGLVATSSRVDAAASKPLNQYMIGGLTIDKKTGLPAIRGLEGAYDLAMLAVDLRTGEQIKVPLPFAPHSVIAHPQKPHSFFAVPNDPTYTEMYEVDFQTQSIVSTLKTGYGQGFYGHGYIDAATSQMFFPEFDASGSTVLVVRSLTKFKELGRISCQGGNPHDLVPLRGKYDGCLLVCCGTVVNIIDLKNRRLVANFSVPVPNQKTGHALALPDGGALLLGNVASGLDHKTHIGNVFHLNNETISVLPFEKQINGEALSSALHPESGLVAVTHQNFDTVTIWDLKRHQCLATLALPNQPRGVIAADDTFVFTNILGEAFHVAVDKPRELIKVESLNGNPVPNASHLLLATF